MKKSLIINSLHLKMNLLKCFKACAVFAFLTVSMSFAPAFVPPQYADDLQPPVMPYEACSDASEAPFQAGEELVYKIYYNLNFVWISAGEVTFKVEDEGNRYHFSATGVTYDSYE